jgi:deoxyribonuclease V
VKFKNLHSWDLKPREAIALQQELAARVILKGEVPDVKTVAGVDLAFSRGGDEAAAGLIVYSFPDLEEVERVSSWAKVTYPYIPGLLSFREGPILEKAFAKLLSDPDVIMFDGQGIAHPRRFGIASHMGLILDKPAIGCAKSRLYGAHDEPGPNVGDWTKLIDKKTDEVIGAVLRTRVRVKPIYVSAGHKITLDRAVKLVLGCLDRTRIPKPTREADKFVNALTR